MTFFWQKTDCYDLVATYDVENLPLRVHVNNNCLILFKQPYP